MLDIDKMAREVCAGYLECAHWADAPEGKPHAKFPKGEQAKALADCREFIAACGELFRAAIELDGYSAEQFGHDFWLSRCGHGTGFWDRDELDVAIPVDVTRPTAKDRDGKPYALPDNLGDALSAIAYGTEAAIAPFAYASIIEERGWLYFT